MGGEYWVNRHDGCLDRMNDWMGWMIGQDEWLDQMDDWLDWMDDWTGWMIRPDGWSDQMDHRIGWIIGLDGWSDCFDDGTRWMIRPDEWLEIIRPDGRISQGWLDGRVWLDGRNWSDGWVWFRVLTNRAKQIYVDRQFFKCRFWPQNQRGCTQGHPKIPFFQKYFEF